MISKAVRPLKRERQWKWKWPRVSIVLLYGVVILGSLATFIHSSWGFATLEAVMFEGLDFAALDTSGWFWARGALAATTLDLGILGFIRLIQEGVRNRWIRIALAGVAILSGYTQFIYATAHAVTLEPTVGVAPWLYVAALLAVQARVLLLPWALPGLIIMYGFAAGLKPMPQEPRIEGEWREGWGGAPISHDAGGPVETPESPRQPLGL